MNSDDEKAFDDIDDDEKRKKKYQKNVRGGSINTLLNDLASAKPPAFYDELIIDNKKLSAAPYTDDKGKINYTKVMKDLVMNNLYTVYGSVSALAYFINSNKDCNERYMPEDAEARSLKGLSSLDAYTDKLTMYAKYLDGTLPRFIKDFLSSYKKAVKMVENQGKEYFNKENIRGAEGVFRDFSENFERVRIMKQAFKTAQAIITGGEAKKDPCHWDFD